MANTLKNLTLKEIENGR